MAASMEYMLCGLPIVSTHSIGGREAFFDEEYVKIVDDTPEAVRDGVAEMINRDLPQTYVRDKTLEKIRIHRHRFMRIVQEIYDKEGVTRTFEDEWDKLFVNSLRVMSPFPCALFRFLHNGMPVDTVRKLASQSTQ